MINHTFSAWLLEKVHAALLVAFVTTLLGIGSWPNVESAACFPLLPWEYLLLEYLGKPIQEGKFPDWFYSLKNPFFPTVGRHTLLIFLVHQPVLYLILLLLGVLS
jgi:uncharacterized membrane protein